MNNNERWNAGLLCVNKHAKKEGMSVSASGGARGQQTAAGSTLRKNLGRRCFSHRHEKDKYLVSQSQRSGSVHVETRIQSRRPDKVQPKC